MKVTTLNKFQTLIALQSTITDGIGLERRSFDLTYLSLLNRLQPTVEIQLGVALRRHSKRVIIEAEYPSIP